MCFKGSLLSWVGVDKGHFPFMFMCAAEEQAVQMTALVEMGNAVQQPPHVVSIITTIPYFYAHFKYLFHTA